MEFGIDCQIKNSPIIIACVPMVINIQITKFKLHQYQLRAISLNLMLTKVTCCTVIGLVLGIRKNSIIRRNLMCMSPLTSYSRLKSGNFCGGL